MFLQRPHMRFDGLYVSRNTYIRTGLTEWRYRNPVHLVTYFRYLRFLPEGRFITRTSPEVQQTLAGPRSMQNDVLAMICFVHITKDEALILKGGLSRRNTRSDV